MGRKFYNLVSKSQGNEETRKVVEACYNTSSDDLGKLIEKAQNEIEAATETIKATTQHTLQVTTQVRNSDWKVTREERRDWKDILRHHRRKDLKLKLKKTQQQRQETNI